MSQVYTINPNKAMTLDRAVAEIECQVGAAAVIDAERQTATIEQGDSFVPAAGFVQVNSLEGASILVTYADEVEQEKPEAAHGDSGGGDSGGLEARTKEQLYTRATKLKISGRSSMDKDELIAAIRAAE